MNAHDEVVFRSAVAHVLSVGGPEILRQPDRFGSMLSDMLGAQSGQLRAERSAIVYLVHEGLAREAVSGQLTPSRRTELIARLREDGGLDDRPAHAAVIALEEAGSRNAIGGSGHPVAAPPSSAVPPTSAVPTPPPPESAAAMPPQRDPAATGWDDPTPLAPAVAATAPNSVSRLAYPEPAPEPGLPGQRGDSRAAPGAWALVGVGALLFAGVITLIVVLLASDDDGGGSVASPGTVAAIAPSQVNASSTLPSTTTTLDPVTAARQQDPNLYAAMIRFDDIIQESTEGRAAVGPLVRGVRDCSINPQEASQQIDDIVANRQSVLNQVNAVSTTTSPQAGQLAGQLQTAIEESISADRHYSNWMMYLYRDYYNTDPVGCPDGSAPIDDEFQAGDDDSEQASAAKEAFVAAYNPVAESMGLRTWAEEQLITRSRRRAAITTAVVLSSLLVAACGSDTRPNDEGRAVGEAAAPTPFVDTTMAPTTTAPTPTSTVEVPSSTTVRSTSGLAAVAGRTIAVDPGHNGRNGAHAAEINRQVDIGTKTKECDTTGTATNAGYSESAYNLDVSLRLAAILRAAGANVVLTRSDDAGWGPCIDERAAIGNRAGADVAISIHADGGPVGGRGFHVNYPVSIKGLTDGIAEESRALAADVRDASAAGTGVPYSSYLGNSALLARDDLGGLNLSKVPKVLLETGNIRDATDVGLLTDPTFRERQANAIASGLATYLAEH